MLTFYLFLAFPMGRLEPPAARWLMGALVVGVARVLPPVGAVLAGHRRRRPADRLRPGVPGERASDRLGAATSWRSRARPRPTRPRVTVAVLVVYALRLARGVAAAAPGAHRRSPSRRCCSCRRTSSSTSRVEVLHARPRHARHAGVGHRRRARPAAARLPGRAAAGRPVRGDGAADAARAARRAAHAGAVAGRRSRRRSTTTRCGSATTTRHGRFREADGEELRAAAEAPGAPGCRSSATASPVAAMVIDETLTEDPELVRAAASATLLAVENGAPRGRAARSRARILEAGHAERRRIERDLHDSAQQRLLALRIHLTLARRAAPRARGPGAARAARRRGRAGDRGAARGGARLHPPILRATRRRPGARGGRAATRRCRCRIDDRRVGRHPEALETDDLLLLPGGAAERGQARRPRRVGDDPPRRSDEGR